MTGRVSTKLTQIFLFVKNLYYEKSFKFLNASIFK